MKFIELQEVYYPKNSGARYVRLMTCNVEEISSITKIVGSRNTLARTIITMKNGNSYKVINDYKTVMSMIDGASELSEELENIENLEKASVSDVNKISKDGSLTITVDDYSSLNQIVIIDKKSNKSYTTYPGGQVELKKS